MAFFILVRRNEATMRYLEMIFFLLGSEVEQRLPEGKMRHPKETSRTVSPFFTCLLIASSKASGSVILKRLHPNPLWVCPQALIKTSNRDFVSVRAG
jgi:hypothetical protein